jgi:hypothetical protein
MADRAWRIAVHEAGHCVATRVLAWSGSTLVPPQFGDNSAAPSILALMAGAGAEALILGDCDRRGVSDDWARWTELMDYLGVGDCGALLWAYTAELLAPHQGLIVRLAAEIWARSLDADEIDAVMFGLAQ